MRIKVSPENLALIVAILLEADHLRRHTFMNGLFAAIGGGTSEADLLPEIHNIA